MTKPQISGMSNFNSSANTVVSEVIDFNANLFFIGIPILGVDSGSLSVSLFAKRRICTLTGFFTGTDSEIKAFRTEIEDEANKASQSAKTYTTSDNDNFQVLINSFQTVRDLTSPNQIGYSIELFSSTNLLV